MRMLVEIDGQTVPLTRAFWVRYAPNGCAHGSCLGDCALTPEQAHKEFTPRQRDRDRETRQGRRHELVTKARWDEAVYPCLSRTCEHAVA